MISPMSKDLRIGERIPIDGVVETHLKQDQPPWQLNGYDVSPTALALIVPVEHKAMKSLPELFKPGTQLTVKHEFFGTQKCVLHRVFSHRDKTTKWVLSFLRNIKLSS